MAAFKTEILKFYDVEYSNRLRFEINIDFIPATVTSIGSQDEKAEIMTLHQQQDQLIKSAIPILENLLFPEVSLNLTPIVRLCCKTDGAVMARKSSLVSKYVEYTSDDFNVCFEIQQLLYPSMSTAVLSLMYVWSDLTKTHGLGFALLHLALIPISLTYPVNSSLSSICPKLDVATESKTTEFTSWCFSCVVSSSSWSFCWQ